MIGIANAISLGMSGASGGAPAFDPIDIAKFVDIWDPAVTATLSLSGSDVISIAGRRGLHTFTDLGSAAQRPSMTTLNGRDAIQGNGTTDFLRCTTIDLPAPSVGTPIYYHCIVRIDAYSSFDTFIAGGASGLLLACLYLVSGTSTFLQSNGATNNTNTNIGGLGNIAEVAALFTGSAADYTKARGVVVSLGATGGSNPAAGMSVFSNHGQAATFCACTLGWWAYALEDLSTEEKASMKAWANTEFGAGVAGA